MSCAAATWVKCRALLPSTWCSAPRQEPRLSSTRIRVGGSRRKTRRCLSTCWQRTGPSTQVVYIGKADVADRRLRQFARFGAGEKIGHWGGRYIWQLLDSDQLLVAWHAISWAELARDYEKRLLAHFAGLHGGVRPFANLTG